MPPSTVASHFHSPKVCTERPYMERPVCASALFSTHCSCSHSNRLRFIQLQPAYPSKSNQHLRDTSLHVIMPCFPLPAPCYQTLQYTPRSFWAFMTDRLPPIQYSSDIAAHFRNQACSECSCNLLCNIHVIHGDELRSASRRLCTGNHD
jgi:hypothetical protein